jgi:hypothetical protein
MAWEAEHGLGALQLRLVLARALGLSVSQWLARY